MKRVANKVHAILFRSQPELTASPMVAHTNVLLKVSFGWRDHQVLLDAFCVRAFFSSFFCWSREIETHGNQESIVF